MTLTRCLPDDDDSFSVFPYHQRKHWMTFKWTEKKMDFHCFQKKEAIMMFPWKGRQRTAIVMTREKMHAMAKPFTIKKQKATYIKRTIRHGRSEGLVCLIAHSRWIKGFLILISFTLFSSFFFYLIIMPPWTMIFFF